jgi:hypothetical protein
MVTPSTLAGLPRRTLLAAATCFALLGYSPEGRACACCSEDGERIEGTAPVQPYERAELDRLRLGKRARLFLTAAGFDGVSGISNPSDTYEVVLTRRGDRWTFAFKDGSGNTGSLAFDVPAAMESFFVDPHDGAQSGAGGPLLFKEWRLRAPVVATGIFAAGSGGGPTVRLILQGRGNSCTSAEQFSSWTLVVTGPKAGYALFGPLAAPASPP